MPDLQVDPGPRAVRTATRTGSASAGAARGIPGAPDAEIAPYVGLQWRAGLLISISLWCYLAMSELSRLSGDRLDATDRSWPFARLLGPSLPPNADGRGWIALGGTPDPGQIAGWLVAFALIDLVLLTSLSLIALRLFSPLPSRRSIGRFVVLAMMTVSLAQSVLTLTVAVALFRSRPGHGVPGVLADVLAFVTWLKWVAVALVLLGLERRLFSPDGQDWRHRIRRVAGGLVVHRFSLLPVVPIPHWCSRPGRTSPIRSPTSSNAGSTAGSGWPTAPPPPRRCSFSPSSSSSSAGCGATGCGGAERAPTCRTGRRPPCGSGWSGRRWSWCSPSSVRRQTVRSSGTASSTSPRR